MFTSSQVTNVCSAADKEDWRLVYWSSTFTELRAHFLLPLHSLPPSVQPLPPAWYLKATRCLALLAWQATRSPQEAKHLVHHVRVIDRLVAGPLHLLQKLLLPPSLLLLLELPLCILAGQLGQALLRGGGDAASGSKSSGGAWSPCSSQARAPTSKRPSWPPLHPAACPALPSQPSTDRCQALSHRDGSEQAQRVIPPALSWGHLLQEASSRLPGWRGPHQPRNLRATGWRLSTSAVQ